MPNSKIYKEMNNERGEANKWKKKKKKRKKQRGDPKYQVLYFFDIIKMLKY